MTIFSTEEIEVYIGVKYVVPGNETYDNVTDIVSSTTPAPLRRRREVATTTLAPGKPDHMTWWVT